MVTLVDVNGKPVVGEHVRLSIQFNKPGLSVSHGINYAVTDSDGKAVLRVAPGKIPVVLQLPGTFEQPIPTGGKEINYVIEQDLDLAPGETIDLGTVEMMPFVPRDTEQTTE